MTRVSDIIKVIEAQVPTHLAEEWDNTGLLIGDADAPVSKIMTCLTATLDVCEEGIARGADLIVSHHPLPFRGIKRMTSDDLDGRRLWALANASISLYSAHTAFDSASRGINQRLAERLDGKNTGVLRDLPDRPGEGAGRWTEFESPLSLQELAARVNRVLGIDGMHLVGDPEWKVSRLAIACGSAGEFLDDARRKDCQGLLTGEVNFHRALEAKALGMGILLPGHYASERFAMEELADSWSSQWSDVEVWASEREEDPLKWVPGRH